MGAFPTAVKIFAVQAAITLASAMVALMLADFKAAYSALVGGGINILATLVFALRVFSVRPGAPAKSMARAFYIGEAIKFAVTVGLFVGVLLWLEVSFLPLFLTYAITMLAFWLVLLLAR
jgi:ATP synthase protein I